MPVSIVNPDADTHLEIELANACVVRLRGADQSPVAPRRHHDGRLARRLPPRSPLMFPQLPAAVRVFLCTQPTDMRKGFDGLTGLVREGFGQDPLTGHLFLFLNRRRDRIKILFWDR